MRPSTTRPAIARHLNKHLGRAFRSLWVPIAVFAAFGMMFLFIVSTMATVHAIGKFGQTEWRNWFGAVNTALESPAATTSAAKANDASLSRATASIASTAKLPVNDGTEALSAVAADLATLTTTTTASTSALPQLEPATAEGLARARLAMVVLAPDAARELDQFERDTRGAVTGGRDALAILRGDAPVI